MNKPKYGKATTVSSLDKWTGFEVDENTMLMVLEAESEGKVGDGEKTCTLKQKGGNYEVVEKEKVERKKNLVLKKVNNESAFWAYKTKIKTITFGDYIDIPSDISNDHKWDLSTTDKGKVMAYIIENSSEPTMLIYIFKVMVKYMLILILLICLLILHMLKV